MYTALGQILILYWKEYGGFKELIASPFLHFAFAVSVLFSFGLIQIDWRAFALSVMPTMLGLSLAAYAITFSLMGSALHRALTAAVDKRHGITLAKVVNATFFHVVLFQLFALLYAFLSKGTALNFVIDFLVVSEGANKTAKISFQSLGEFFGCFLTTYSTMLLLSVGFAMFRLGRLNPKQENASAVGDNNPPANDDGGRGPAGSEVTNTLRFKFVAWLAKSLGLYNN